MSDLYEVRVIRMEAPSTVVLAVQVVASEPVPIPNDLSFALGLLRDACNAKAPLAREVSGDDLRDEGWASANTSRFVRAVRRSKVANAPPKAAVPSPTHPYWRRGKFMRAELRIQVTDPRWLAHLDRGTVWRSRAYQVAQSHERGPSARSAGAARAGAFVWIPREACLALGDWTAKLPPLIEAPALSPSSYEVVARLRGSAVNALELQAWKGRAVAVEAGSRTQYGALGCVDSRGAIGLVLPGAAGVGGGLVSGVKSIGLMEPKPGRSGTALRQSDVLRSVPVTVAKLQRSGTEVALELRLPPLGSSLGIKSETDILNLMVAPLRKGTALDLEPAPLSKALELELEACGLEGAEALNELLPELARKYVASFALSRPPKQRPARFDALSHERVRELLAAPWPTAKLSFRVTDPKWIAHLSLEAFRSVAVAAAAPAPRPRRPAPRPKTASQTPTPERLVLVQTAKRLRDSRVWSAECVGTTLRFRSGLWSQSVRNERRAAFPSEEKAKVALDRAVAARRREGYRPGQRLEQAQATLAARLGLVLEAGEGTLVVRGVGPPAEKIRVEGLTWFKPGDEISAFSARALSAHVESPEELATALEHVPPGESVVLDARRVAARVGAGIEVVLR